MSRLRWLWVGIVLLAVTPAHAQAPAPVAAKKRPRGKAPAPKVLELMPTDLIALAGTDTEGAARAAETIGLNDTPAAHEALLDALALGLAPAVAIAAINALTVHPAPKDIAALRRYALHQNPTVRSAALGALASYPSPEAHQAISDGLRDTVSQVRAAAAAAAARGRVRVAVDELMQLLARGEDTSARALGAMADNEIAKQLVEQLGKAPERQLARALGTILLRDDFGPDSAKVDLVRALSRIEDDVAVTELSDYIDATPKKPARTSRQEAVLIVQARKGGAK